MDDNELEEKTEQIRILRRVKLQWSDDENSFRNRQKFRRKDRIKYDSSFSTCAAGVFRESVFGVYMKSFNEKEKHDIFLNENKLGITQWDLTHSSELECKYFTEKNAITEGLYDLLLKAVKVKKMDVIDWSYFYDCLFSLRLSNCNMEFIDDGLKNFKHLVVLIVTGNFLQRIPGELLPRKLQFLEAYANEISELHSLVTKPPKRILHIGLGRNKLAGVHDCHLLTNSQSFRRLRTLDLSDNDFVELLPLLRAVSNLQSLQSLNLEGNPCSTCISYKDAVLEILPRLVYLDTVQLMEEDRKVVDSSVVDAAVLVFTCHRITGLKPPPKEKKAKQSIHVEVSLPLLAEIDLTELDPEPEEEKPPQPSTPSPPPEHVTTPSTPAENKKDARKASIKSTDKKSKGSKPGKPAKVKEPGPYDGPDEYESEVRRHVRDASFKTDRVAWSKTMQFPEDAVVVQTSESDLVKIRDTLRSRVEVKVVYLKTMMPPPPKKGKGGKKDKKGKGGKKDKKAKGKENKKGAKQDDTKKEETVVPETQEEELAKPPEEIILKKVTLAKFKCDLHTINWSDKIIDFYWAKHVEVGDNAIPVGGSLRAIKYVEGKEAKAAKKRDKKKGKDKAKEEEGVADLEAAPGTQPQKLPSYMTCQVGFSLKRSYFLTADSNA